MSEIVIFLAKIVLALSVFECIKDAIKWFIKHGSVNHFV